MSIAVKEFQTRAECQLLRHPLLFLKQLKPWSWASLIINVT